MNPEFWKSVSGSHYDPETRQIHLAQNAPCFVAVHEWAHSRQHEKMTLAFRAWRWTRRLPWMRRVTRLWVEREANQIAREEMERCGIWDKESQEIARTMLWRHARVLVIP